MGRYSSIQFKKDRQSTNRALYEDVIFIWKFIFLIVTLRYAFKME